VSRWATGASAEEWPVAQVTACACGVSTDCILVMQSLHLRNVHIIYILESVLSQSFDGQHMVCLLTVQHVERVQVAGVRA
jgi:hypothetical protein